MRRVGALQQQTCGRFGRSETRQCAAADGPEGGRGEHGESLEVRSADDVEYWRPDRDKKFLVFICSSKGGVDKNQLSASSAPDCGERMSVPNHQQINGITCSNDSLFPNSTMNLW